MVGSRLSVVGCQSSVVAAVVSALWRGLTALSFLSTKTVPTRAAALRRTARANDRAAGSPTRARSRCETSRSCSGVRPRQARYSRACAASGLAQLLLEEGAGALVHIEQRRRAVSRFARFLRASRTCTWAAGSPSFWATRRTASGKVMLSIFCTKLKTSPDAPQPKQWKNWRVACTENDGVFSW